MYQSYYGFSEKPFTITPNPHFLFLSKTHKEVFAHLLYGIRQRSGFIELIGEVGTGKTTVLRTLMSQLEEESYRLALIFNPSLSATDLLRGINREFGLPAAATPAELLEDLNDFLLRENAAGRTVILVIDEAQNLEPSVLEQIRLLSNLETDTTKLIQIILAGQPELAEVLSRPGLRQLSQRITVRFRLQPMDFDDTAAYIEHRLRIAGSQGRPIFTPAAVRQIFRLSGGLPRLINVLCDRALLVGYADDVREISPRQVAVARRELQRENAVRRWWMKPALLAAVPLLFAAAGAGWLLGKRDSPPPAPAASSVPSPPMTAGPVAPADVAATLRLALARESEGASALQALNAHLPLWHLQPLSASGAPFVDLKQLARQRNLQITPISGSPSLLRRYATPVILSLPLADGQRYVAVTRMDDQNVTVAASAGAITLRWEALRTLWNGRGYLVWKNHLQIPSIENPGTTGEEVARLQQLLQENGFYEGLPSSVYDERTIAGIKGFQAAHGIETDGRAGPQTLILLYQNSRFAAPLASAGEEQ